MTEGLTLLVLAGLMIASAFFSASETALFSLDPRWLRTRPKTAKLAHRVEALKARPAALLTTILIGNELVNISASALVAGWFLSRFHQAGGIKAVVFMTLLLLTIGEITPKSLAIRFPDRVAKGSVLFLPGFSWLISPFRDLLARIAVAFTRKPVAEKPPSPESEDIESLLAHGERLGIIDPEEREMTARFVDLLDRRVSEVMVPRTDMMTLETSTSIPKAIALVRKAPFSRIPVYKENLDRVVGLVLIRDLIQAYNGPPSELPSNLSPLVKEVFFVPETKKIADLLRLMRYERIPLAVVIDEHGGTAGLITLEGIVEEVFGELESPGEEKRWRILPDGSFLVDGRVNVEELAERLEVTPPEEEVETAGGLVFSLAGRLPYRGERFDWRGLELQVVSLRGLSVGQIRIVPPKSQKEEQPR